MSIKFQCQSCSKQVRAPDEAGGKRGKCPYCGTSVFIPAPPDESESIGLAPINQDTEARKEQLRQESIDYAASVDHARSAPPDGGAAGRGATSRPAGTAQPAAGGDSEIDIPVEVSGFVRAMHGSKLEIAERRAGRLKRCGSAARDYVESLLTDEMGPAIDDIPPPLARGFLKALRDRLK